MTNKDYYFLSKLAKAEKTIKQASVTTCTHKALTPTEPVAKALGESDKIMYGQGSVAKIAADKQKEKDDGQGGSVTDAVMDYAYTNSIFNPLQLVGRGVGLLSDESPQFKSGKASSFIPGVSGYRVVQRRRQVDRERSGGQRDRSAQVHELAGKITQRLLFSLLGGLGGNYLAHKVMQPDNNRDKALVTSIGLGGGALTGLGVSSLVDTIGGLVGTAGSSKKEREAYLKGNNMWKNYLIPGYSGYQNASGVVDYLKNT